MLAESLISSEIGETVVLQDHGSSLGSVGTIVRGAIYGAGGLDDLTVGEVHLGRRETSHSVENGAYGSRQGLGLGQQSLDKMLVIRIRELPTL